VNVALDPMITAWTQLSTATQAGVSTQINATKTALNKLVDTLNLYLDTIIGPLFHVIFYHNLAILNL
jgi:hypothetical protein